MDWDGDQGWEGTPKSASVSEAPLMSHLELSPVVWRRWAPQLHPTPYSQEKGQWQEAPVFQTLEGRAPAPS